MVNAALFLDDGWLIDFDQVSGAALAVGVIGLIYGKPVLLPTTKSPSGGSFPGG